MNYEYFNMYVLQCILCASERKFVWVYGALQIKIIIIIIDFVFPDVPDERYVLFKTGNK